jgi:hypothetical protein
MYLRDLSLSAISRIGTRFWTPGVEQPRSFQSASSSLASDYEHRSPSLLMSNSPHSTPGSVCTPARSFTLDSFPKKASNSPPRLHRKSPPPPKLNLDDLKPTISTTTTNTSTNASLNPSTAFVFTSSRTLRSLHNHSLSAGDAQPLLPPANILPSPRSSPTDAPSSRSTRASKRVVLSQAQLALHSVGALDARCIVSPSMRAAGFVPLPHSPLYQPSSLSDSSTPMPSPVITPAEPPRFPPIVFFSSPNVTSTPLWEYQRNLAYGLSTVNSAGWEYGPSASKPAARPSIHPLSVSKDQNSGSNSSELESNSTSFGSSFSSLFSKGASQSSMTSIASSDYAGFEDEEKSSQRLREPSPRHAPVDGYPFPTSPPRNFLRPHESAPSTGFSQPIPLTLSPSVSSTASGSVTPLAPSPNASVTSLPQPSSGSGSTSTTGSGSLSPLRSEAGDRAVSHMSKDLSITELCMPSPHAWIADTLLLPQLHSVPASKGDIGRGTGGSSDRKVIAPSGEKQGEGAKGVAQARPDLLARDGKTLRQEGLEGVKHTSSAKLKLGAVEGNEDEGEVLKAKKKDKYRGREKDREGDKEKGKERRRHRGKASTAKSHSSSSPTSSPTSRTPSPPDDEEQGRTKVAKDRSRSTKEKALLGSSSSFSSWSFPPRDDRLAVHKPHTLGSRDSKLERERAWEAGEFAKDTVLAHRERDRQHAREVERDRRGSHKVSTFHVDLPIVRPSLQLAPSYPFGLGMTSCLHDIRIFVCSFIMTVD